MRYSAEQERALMERIFALRDDPLAFITFAYPWGVPNTPLAAIAGPWDWQREELVSVAEHMRKVRFAVMNDLPLPIFRKAWSSGRGPGKSALFGMVAHWHLSTHLGAQTVVAANTEGQLRTKTFPEIARWVTMSVNSHWFEVEGIKIYPQAWFGQLVADQLKIDTKYWNITGQTWTEENPEAFAGAHNAYGLALLFDEASGIPGGVWDTADGFLTDRTPYRFHLAASQMRRNTGRFYDIFHKPEFRRTWQTRSLDTRYVKCGVDPTWVSNFIALHGEDSDEVRVEVMGVAPNTGDMQFIPTSTVRAAQARPESEAPHDKSEPLIMGVDPAPRGRTVIRFRQGRNGRDCVGRDTVRVLMGSDNVQIADEVSRLNQRHKPDAICIDFGMGTGVIDICKHTHKIKVVEVRFSEKPSQLGSQWLTRSGELWAFMAEWLHEGRIDGGDTLFRDLTEREWEWADKDETKKKLEDKEKLRSRGIPSPDDADALACTFAVRVPRRDQKTSRTGGRTTKAEGLMLEREDKSMV